MPKPQSDDYPDTAHCSSCNEDVIGDLDYLMNVHFPECVKRMTGIRKSRP